MKISELIDKLTNINEIAGDVDIYFDYCGKYQPFYEKYGDPVEWTDNFCKKCKEYIGEDAIGGDSCTSHKCNYSELSSVCILDVYCGCNKVYVELD